MKSKIILTVVTAALITLTGVAADASAKKAGQNSGGVSKMARSQLAAALMPAQAAPKKQMRRQATQVFRPEKGIVGEHTYVVRLNDAPVATYRGGVQGLAATSPAYNARKYANRGAAAPGSRKLDVNAPAARAYTDYLRQRQAEFKQRASGHLGRPVQSIYDYQLSLNGISVRMTQDEALRMAELPGVSHISRDVAHEIDTDRGPIFIGAGSIWDGSALEGIGTKGEGIIVGILDTGINGDHPSFAAVGGDGYAHVNPYGSGVYKGECFSPPALVCNDKLIGRYAFLATQPTLNSEDQDGHGSHTAGTAAGNVVPGVTLADAEGTPTDYALGDLSGVAPHANIIAFRVCAPSCFGSDIVAAVDQAIIDGVDVLNHSIGSSPGSPWEDPKAMSFLNARDAGISIANSAGNSGPGAGTAEASGNAPWVTGVAASSHDRAYPMISLTPAGGESPGAMEGRGITDEEITAPVVYAGNYANPNDPNGDPAQCLQPFPAGTFNGEIVLCDRGAIARVQKGINVRDGGAAGFILANVDGGDSFLADDVHVIPGIQIVAADGNVLRDWINSGGGQMATISRTGPVVADEAAADWMAGFSSRGPYTGYDWLSPSVSAPGLAIYAAYRDPEQYAQIQGTSMSSPHVAGALALLKAAHPDWTDAEITSALITTGNHNMVKEDGVTPADHFDFGGGRIQLQHAARAGLVLDESTQAFEDANPAIGGDPRTLNVAFMVDDECLAKCTWDRTFRATTAGTWTLTGDNADGIVLSAEPSSFVLAAGESRTVTISADVSSLEAEQWYHADARFSHDGDAPDSVLPVVIRTTSGLLPDIIRIEASRDAGSYLAGGFLTAEINSLDIEPFGLANEDIRTVSITGETQSFTPYSGSATAIEFYDVAPGSAVFSARTFDSDSPDADLFMGKDLNNDGQITPNEELCASGSEASDEFCELERADLINGGRYWVAVINYASETPDATHETKLEVVNVGPVMNGAMGASGPVDVPGGDPFNVRIFYNQEMVVGQKLHGAILLSSPAGEIGMVPVEITRAANDLQLSASSTQLSVGDTLTVGVNLAANFTPEDRTYVVDAEIPEGYELVPGSITGSDEVYVINDMIIWVVDQPSKLLEGRSYRISINGPNVDTDDPLYDAACDTGFGGYFDLESFGFRPDPLIHGDTISYRVLQGQNMRFFGIDHTSGVSVTDDGFVYFNSTPGSDPWVNTGLPNSADPNDMSAVLWSDFEVVYDQAENRGVTLATAGPNLSLVEYDAVEPAPAGSSSDRVDFQVFLSGLEDDEINQYEIVYAYKNVVGDSWADATVGVENPFGTAGSQYMGPISEGLMVCFDYLGPTTDDTVLSYQLQVGAEAGGSMTEHRVYNIVDNPGSAEVLDIITIEVEAYDTDDDGVIDTADNCTLVANPDQRDTDGDGYGNMCDADFNQDGVVNFADLGYLAQKWASQDPNADINGDGQVNNIDLDMVRAMFYSSPGPSGLDN